MHSSASLFTDVNLIPLVHKTTVTSLCFYTSEAMAPIRRYLRITKYSVLECRIYLDNPALAQTWLLNPRDPVLPKVIEAVRPLVLPKLREEKERANKKSSKKRGIKDVIAQGARGVANQDSVRSLVGDIGGEC